MREDWKVSNRSTLQTLRIDTSSYHYKPCCNDLAALKGQIKEIYETRVRYGYRRVAYVLRR